MSWRTRLRTSSTRQSAVCPAAVGATVIVVAWRNDHYSGGVAIGVALVIFLLGWPPSDSVGEPPDRSATDEWRPRQESNLRPVADEGRRRSVSVAPTAGIEPATYRLGGDRSIQLSYVGNGRTV